jgi:hypothetical protein
MLALIVYGCFVAVLNSGGDYSDSCLAPILLGIVRDTGVSRVASRELLTIVGSVSSLPRLE